MIETLRRRCRRLNSVRRQALCACDAVGRSLQVFSVPASEQYSQAKDSKASHLWAAESYQTLRCRRHSARRFCSFFIFPANFAFSNVTRERMVKGWKQQAALTRQHTVKRARRRQTQRR